MNSKQYIVVRNPFIDVSERRVRPLHLYAIENDICAFVGKRNLAGLVHTLSSQRAQLEVDTRSFTNKDLLNKLTNYLDKRKVQYTTI
ncbi:MAG: hypothetical protein AABX08_03630 [Nanoarchaeota archaeon]